MFLKTFIFMALLTVGTILLVWGAVFVPLARSAPDELAEIQQTIGFIAHRAEKAEDIIAEIIEDGADPSESETLRISLESVESLTKDVLKRIRKYDGE